MSLDCYRAPEASNCIHNGEWQCESNILLVFVMFFHIVVPGSVANHGERGVATQSSQSVSWMGKGVGILDCSSIEAAKIIIDSHFTSFPPNLHQRECKLTARFPDDFSLLHFIPHLPMFFILSKYVSALQLKGCFIDNSNLLEAAFATIQLIPGENELKLSYETDESLL